MIQMLWGMGLALIALPAAAVEITQVRADQVQFDPARGQRLAVRFSIDQSADTIMRIYDGRDHLIRRIDLGRIATGPQVAYWDGRDTQGRTVPPEAYVYTLEVIGDDGGQALHDLSDLTGGEPLMARDVRWDAEVGVIRYVLDKPARVNVRVGLKDNGPLLGTVIDWVPRRVGPQAETWDGRDASKVLDLSKHPGLAVVVDAYSLSENTVLIGPRVDQVAFVETDAPPELRMRRPQKQKRMHYHADQPLETRGDVVVSVDLGPKTKRDKQGRWVVSSRTPVRLQVAEADRERVLARRFEPVFFVDGIFAFENEVGFLPMTWNWDTESMLAGEHFITVNLRGYEGNFGMATLKVWVEKEESRGQ